MEWIESTHAMCAKGHSGLGMTGHTNHADPKMPRDEITQLLSFLSKLILFWRFYIMLVTAVGSAASII